jgi:pre-60S factor REI1
LGAHNRSKTSYPLPYKNGDFVKGPDQTEAIMASMQAVSATGANAASHPYTCNTCQVAYRNIDLQKTHMKSDWHRYNLKRRVAALPPISADTFTEKVLQARAVSTAEADKAYFERSCDVCDKTYYSENAYQNHLLSQKHKLNEGSGQCAVPPSADETNSVISSAFSLGEPTAVSRPRLDSEVEDDIKELAAGVQKLEPTSAPKEEAGSASNAEIDEAAAARESGAATPVQATTDPKWTLQTCIFCNYDSPTVPLNALHMERIHGMFIPEKDFVADLDGLVKYLQRKVREYHQCLFCNKFKTGTFAVQTHMRDTGHCKIPYDTEDEQLEIGDYYDFRSTYSDGEASDDEEGEEEQGGAKLSRSRAKKNGDGGEEDDGWETDSSASSLDSADLTAVPAEGHLHQFERLSKHPHHSRHDPRHRHQADGWHSHAHKHTHAAFYDEYEMHLPSGKSVGHRSLNKYFRQNLTNYPSAEEQEERKMLRAASDDEDENTVTRGRRGREMVPRGVGGLAGVSEEKKQRVRRAEQHGRSLETVSAKKKDYAYGKKLNNYKGYYYRYQGGG